MSKTPTIASDAVLLASEDLAADTPQIGGYDFNRGIDYAALLQSYMNIGFQATNFGLAVEELNRMLAWRLVDEPVAENEDDEMRAPEARAQVTCMIFLGYTSNMISSGIRDIIRYLCQHKLVDAIVTTGGGIEEDFMKCFTPTYVGDFNLSGAALRKKGINRIGNTLVPNNNYVSFEKWVMPILDQLVDEQPARDPPVWTPSAIINRLGKEVRVCTIFVVECVRMQRAQKMRRRSTFHSAPGQ